MSYTIIVASSTILAVLLAVIDWLLYFADCWACRSTIGAW